MIIKGAEARIKQVETGGLFRGRKELLAHLNGEKTILSEAVRAKCYDCMGYYSDGRQDCECPLCSLYPFNPYNPNKRKGASKMTDEQKQQAAERLRSFNLTRSKAPAVAKPPSTDKKFVKGR